MYEYVNWTRLFGMKFNFVNKILLSLLLVLASCSAPRVTPVSSIAPSPTQTTTVLPSPLPATHTPLPAGLTIASTLTNSFPSPQPTHTQLFTPTPTTSMIPSGRIFYLFPPHWVDAWNGWATTEELDSQIRLLRTTDGGFIWQDVTPAISPTFYFFLDENIAWGVRYHPEGKDEIYHTIDGGRTWQVLPTLFSYSGIHFFDKLHGLAIAPQDYSVDSTQLELYITTDGGQTWNQHHIAPVFVGEKVSFYYHFFQFSNGQSLLFQNPTSFWVGGGWQKASDHIPFIVSRDAGQSWQPQDIPVPEGLGAMYVDLPVFLNEQEGFFSLHYTGSDGPYQGFFQGILVYSTSDGGITWIKCPSVFRPGTHAVHFISLVDWVLGSGTSLLITHDGGQNWQEQPLPISPDGGYASYFSDPQNGWLIINNAGQRFYRTQDSGKTWQEFNPVVLVP